MHRSAFLPAIAAAAARPAAAPARAAPGPAPVTISPPHTFALGLEAGATADGTLAADWGFQDGAGNGATTGARGASLAPGGTAFGPESVLPRDLAQLVAYGRHSIAGLVFSRRVAGTRDRLAIAFGSPDGPSLGRGRTVATDDVAFLPRLAVASNGSGLLAWIARASRGRRIVRVAIKGAGARFGRASTIAGTGRADTVTAAVDAQGDRLVAFVRSGRLLARYRPRDRGWAPVDDLGPVAAGTDNRPAALVTS